MKKILRISLLLLFPLALVINLLLSKYPSFVEKYYSTSVNKIMVQSLSKLTSIIPFSLYEFTMYLLVFSAISFILYFLYYILFRKNKVIVFLKNIVLNILTIISIAYFLFIILWGINYNRLPLQVSLVNEYNKSNITNISQISSSKEDLANLYEYLIYSANKTRSLVAKNNNNVMKCNTDYKGIISRAQLGYDNILDIIPSLSGNYGLPKYIISSELMCYTGICGIYFPWTGEANINIAIPDIYLPSTTSHEMAHQRGFASEDEANFIAYLACINHPSIDFNYSGYILALNHTASALKNVDPILYNELSKDISEDVLRDVSFNRKFWENYEGKIDKISNDFNNVYLKSNGISEGTKSYGKMVDLLLTYYKLYPFM